MAHLNETLTIADFRDNAIVRESDREGFKGTPTVVRLQGPFKLYKLTGDRAPQHPTRNTVTPWWSAVDPYHDDYEGAQGRFKQAFMNMIDMSSMVRYMSAVKVEWNPLSEYVEISVKRGEQISCFWGEFAPMPLTSDVPPDRAKLAEYSATSSSGAGYRAAHLPKNLGALSAWQFYIPNFNNEYIEGGIARTCINAHDMAALGHHFGLNFSNPADLRKISVLFLRFRNDELIRVAAGSNPLLAQMIALHDTLWKLEVAPRKVLDRFCELGVAFINGSGSEPVKAKVVTYLRMANQPAGLPIQSKL